MTRKPKPNSLGCALRGFFADHLPCLRGMSPHTIHSYRDCIVMLLRFTAAAKHCCVTKLDIDDLGPKVIVAFLQHLEDERHSSPATRNVRLAAIHAFFRYLAAQHPDRLEHCQQVLGIPFKRTRSRPVDYLEYDELQAVLAAVDRSTADGRRDYALLVTLFNTGARVQELLDVRVCDLQLVKPFHVRLFGKGRKERICPLWPQTAQLLQSLFAEQNRKVGDLLFRNHRGQPLTRFGVRYILAKYCQQAGKTISSLAQKRLHPHTMRHSSAVHLLKAGVDIVTISQWLGHASINTTNRYASVDLDMKRAAISKIAPTDGTSTGEKVWCADPSILTWLESL